MSNSISMSNKPIPKLILISIICLSHSSNQTKCSIKTLRINQLKWWSFMLKSYHEGTRDSHIQINQRPSLHRCHKCTKLLHHGPRGEMVSLGPSYDQLYILMHIHNEQLYREITRNDNYLEIESDHRHTKP